MVCHRYDWQKSWKRFHRRFDLKSRESKKTVVISPLPLPCPLLTLYNVVALNSFWLSSNCCKIGINYNLEKCNFQNEKSSLDFKLKLYLFCTIYIVATLRMAGALEKSSEVMKYMQQLVKVPEIQATMQELSKEMMKVWECYMYVLRQILHEESLLIFSQSTLLEAYYFMHLELIKILTSKVIRLCFGFVQ